MRTWRSFSLRTKIIVMLMPALVPMLDRPIPVIADPYVDREFGTGALKATPAK